MSGIYEEVEIEDMHWNEEELAYTYPCPCGDKFSIDLEELYDGEEVASCPSCTLRIRVIFEESDLPPLPDDEEDEAEQPPVVATENLDTAVASAS